MFSKARFEDWQSQGYNYLPVIIETKATPDTLISLYSTLANQPDSYLLESTFNTHDGRYSYIGVDCSTKIIATNNQVTHIQHGKSKQITCEPLDYIEKVFDSFRTPPLDLAIPFLGGFVGYFGYDTIRYIEPRLGSANHVDPLCVPDIYLLLSEQFIVYDNLSHHIYIVVYTDPAKANAYEEATRKALALQERLKQVTPSAPKEPITTTSTPFLSNTTREDYEAKVEKAREFFKAGDAMQLILSQRFSKPFTSDPFRLYQTLRAMNPSPYMYYFNLGDFQIVGASPEVLVKVEDNQVLVRPLAGTRRRGKTPAEDRALEKELLSDTKELAEHLMLIDLGRNDIGRVCKIGSVKVVKQMVIERFSHVLHISSTVIGEVQPHKSLLDILKATFPAGTVSGAPKIRAMELIDQLEEDKRGIYGGAIGYLGWNGNMDLAIALRTALVKNNMIYIQTGAGLVADSNPVHEWQECLNKARALFVAIEQTENQDRVQHDISYRQL